jgi:hypothetical protein
MAVVINEFEVIHSAPPAAAATAAPAGAPPEPVEPKDVTPLLRALEAQALRAWAH